MQHVLSASRHCQIDSTSQLQSPQAACGSHYWVACTAANAVHPGFHPGNALAAGLAASEASQLSLSEQESVERGQTRQSCGSASTPETYMHLLTGMERTVSCLALGSVHSTATCRRLPAQYRWYAASLATDQEPSSSNDIGWCSCVLRTVTASLGKPQPTLMLVSVPRPGM